MEDMKNDNIEILVTDDGELIVDFNLIDVCFDIPEIEAPDLLDIL